MLFAVIGGVKSDTVPGNQPSSLATISAVQACNPVASIYTSAIRQYAFVCQKCGHSFSTKQNLQNHDTTRHTGNYRYKCHLCPKGFQRENLMNAHMKRHGNSEICVICGKAYVSPVALRYHMDRCVFVPTGGGINWPRYWVYGTINANKFHWLYCTEPVLVSSTLYNLIALIQQSNLRRNKG